MKRYIYIIIGIIVLAMLAISVLFYIKNTSGGNSGSLSEASTTGSLPAAGTQGGNGTGTGAGGTTGTLGLSSSPTSTSGGNGQMTVQNFGVLSSDPVFDYFVNTNNNITAIEPNGEIVAISNGQSAVVNSSTINNLISASFSYDGQKILVSYGTSTNPQSGIFNVATNAWTALPQGMLSPQWSPANNYQIAYLATINNGGLALATMNASNLKATPTTLFVLNAGDLALQWPMANDFVLSDKPTSQNAGSAWLFNASANTLAPLIYEVAGAEALWSHDASIPYGLVFFNNPSGQGNTLQLQPLLGTLPNESLSFLTLPSKCAFNAELMPATSTPAAASTTTSTTKTKAPAAPTSTPYLALYCGVPRSSSGFSSAHLPDDYNTMALFTSDDIYKINTATGAEQTLWSDNTQNMDVSDVKFFNDALFFVNRYDQKLYGLTFTN